MPYATVSDVEVEFGDIPEVQLEKVETKLDQAEDLIRQAFPDLNDRVVDGRTTVIRVKQVESEMVAAVLRNPNGAKSSYTQDMVGPFSRQSQATFDAATASGILTLTERHRAMLGEVRSAGIYTVPLGGR